MSKQSKIIVCGDVEGRFKQLFNRINSVQKKAGQFDMLFCIGNFFGDDNSEWEAYATGKEKVPIDTFILGPNQLDHCDLYPDHNGCTMCPRVTYLGKKGIYTGSSGLKVAYLSGNDGVSMKQSSPFHFSASDVDSLMSSLSGTGVDILLTTSWPRSVGKYASEIAEFDTHKVGSTAVSQLALTLKPRYHFSGLQGVYYERQPYRNHKVLQEGAKPVTRFLGMAKVGNAGKKKFMYAFNIVPMAELDENELVKQPEDATECPYKSDDTVSKAVQDKEEKAAQYFYDQNTLDRGHVGGRGRGRGGKRQYHDRDGDGPQHKKPAGPCWFCLGSPEVEKHLVVSVGMQTYVCLAKGGLTSDHVLITPIGHHQSITAAPQDVIEEAEKYKSALRKCFKSHGKATVFFERNYKTSHMQIQVVPVPLEIVDGLKEIFEGMALCQNIDLSEIPEHSDIKQIIEPGTPYFYAELPKGEKLFCRIKKAFPLQFGREVLADSSILNMPERVDWKNCSVGKEEESSMAAKFRNMFEKYDFNM